MDVFKQSHYDKTTFHEQLEQVLASCPEKTIQTDGTVTVERVNNPYFVVNNTWNGGFICEIKQFKKIADNYKYLSQNVLFSYRSPLMQD